MSAIVEIGSRIQDAEGSKGTVLYIGPVAAAKNKDDIWYGVAWDNVERGKHDGSCVDSSGVVHRYFWCEGSSGSFVKPHTIAPRKSFTTSLKERYVEMDAPIVAPNNLIPDAYVLTSKGVQKVLYNYVLLPITLLCNRTLNFLERLK